MTEIKTVAYHTLGCKLNFSETSTIGRLFKEAGYQRVDFSDIADVYVVNTCSVTELADKKNRAAIRKAIKQNPEGIVAVIGCYSQLKPNEISKIEGVDIILGTQDKFKIIDCINEYKTNKKQVIHSCEIDCTKEFNAAYSVAERTRSFLKVQDGCDYNCTYCTIPLARGKSRNTSIQQIINSANEIVSKGLKEIVLTGVNIGDFGRSTGENLLDLLKELEKVDGIERIRISSIEPNLLKDEIIELVASSKKIMPHFHIPLQSGCNKILALMKRRYKREIFADRTLKIKQFIPNAFIGVDVIVGFPGETDEDFEETYKFIENLDVSFLHVFSYSERAETPAITMPNKVHPKDKEIRSKRLHELSAKKHKLFYLKYQNSILPVLFESQQNGEYMSGFTNNYINVKHLYDTNFIGKVSKVKLTKIAESGEYFGEIL